VKGSNSQIFRARPMRSKNEIRLTIPQNGVTSLGVELT
jgi:hypothetical protein